MRALWLAVAWLLAGCMPLAAQPPPDRLALLRHGINITNWFRYPGSRDPAVLRAYVSDQAMRDLATAGFGFVRLAVDPAVIAPPAMRQLLLDAIRRWQRAGLAVVVSLHPTDWHLETDPADRARLLTAWQALAPALRGLDPQRTVPELLNEPVFLQAPASWHALQHAALGVIRAALPDSTVVLTGHDWGSIAGLLALTPEADANVIYSFHFYQPAELTSLAAYRQALDRLALAALPFPVTDSARCSAGGANTDAATREVIRYYCRFGWSAARVGAAIGDAAAWAARHHVALLAGEFGASAALNPAARLAWLGTVRQACEAADIGWALWGYEDVMGLAVPRPLPLRPRLDADVLVALGLSPLRVTSGGGLVPQARRIMREE